MKYFSKRYLFFVFILFFLNVQGQKLLKHFNVDNGLLSSETYQVIQDHKGYIWITTDAGVSRYDGYKFEHFNSADGLPESTILELFEDSKNRIWFVAITCDLAYLENDSIYVFPFNDSIKNRNPKSRLPLKKSFYVDSSENVYFGICFKDIMKITPKGEVETINPRPANSNSFYHIENKHLFTGKKIPFDNYILQNPFFKDVNHQLTIERTNIRTISLEYEGKVLYTDYNILYVFEKDGTYSKHVFDNDILWLSVDNQNNLWFGFYKDGAVVYEDFSFTKKRHHLLPQKSISSVLEDNEGSYWVSTIYNGVYMFSSFSFVNYSENEGVGNVPITEIESFNNSILFAGAGEDLYMIKNKKLSAKEFKLKKLPTVCRHLSVDDSSILISHQKNGNRRIKSGKEIKLGMINYATAMVPVNDGIIGFHRRNIVYEKNGEKKIIESKLFNEVYEAIKINDTLIWFVTNNGLMEFTINQDEPNEVQLSPMLRSRSNAISLSKDSVIWVATNDYGLLSISNNKVKSFLPEILKEKLISSILNLDSLMFLGTNNGVLRFRKNGDSIIYNNAYRISSGNGLLSNDINDIAYFDNHIYVANSLGVTSFPVNQTYPPSPVFISKVTINGNDTVIKHAYDFSYDQNYIDIEFLSLNYQRNEDLTYMYKLVGVDRDWRFTNQRIAQYSALRPGNYAFKVKAINTSGLISKNPASFLININKPYYDTIWFKVLGIVIAIFIMSVIFFIIFRIKIREAYKRNRVEHELNRSRQQALSAQMNPHFIYNSLNSVQSYILKNDKVAASEYLSKLGRLMRNILNNSQNQTITLREEFDALEKYMEMEQLRFKGVFQYRINVCREINLDTIHVPPLIIQPFVENAIHHGLRLRKEGGELLVDASIKEDILQIIVKDNGVGIDKAKEYNSKSRKNHKSFGTEITHKRLKLLEEMNKKKVKLFVSQAYPKDKLFPGTKVEIDINLSE